MIFKKEYPTILKVNINTMRLFACSRCLMLFLIVSIIPVMVMAQTSKEEIFQTIEKSGGVNYAYPFKHAVASTPPPPGYEPFYISHFGRHGSRYLVKDSEYKEVLDVFYRADSANALTPSGKTVYRKLQVIWKDAEGHGGKLTPLGTNQLKDIALRMYQQYPGVFTANASVSAVSTTVERCVHSMHLFCGQLKELNDQLAIKEDADSSHMKYLNYHTAQAVAFRYAPDGWRKDYQRFEQEHVKPGRLVRSLFADSSYIKDQVNPVTLMWDLYDIAGNLQNMQSPVSLYPVFTKKELLDLWQCRNYSLYVQYANAAINRGMMMENAKPLLKDMIDKANQAIANKEKGASFRFGHDGNIIPLAMLMHLENTYQPVADPNIFYKAWSDFKVAPMAANIQLVLFKKAGVDEVLVKFLQQEKEVRVPPIKSKLLPYYRWSDVFAYYQSLL